MFSKAAHKTKTHLFQDVLEMSDPETLSVFLTAIEENPFCRTRIKKSGTLQEILQSLDPVPKAVLDSAFTLTFGQDSNEDDYADETLELEFDSDDEDEDEDEDEDDVEEEEEEEEDDDEDE